MATLQDRIPPHERPFCRAQLSMKPIGSLRPESLPPGPNWLAIGLTAMLSPREPPPGNPQATSNRHAIAKYGRCASPLAKLEHRYFASSPDQTFHRFVEQECSTLQRQTLEEPLS